MHRDLKGKRGATVEYIHINGVFGYVSSLINTEIMHAGMEKETEINTIIAVNKLLWVQNDFFSKYYVRHGLGALDMLTNATTYMRLAYSEPSSPTAFMRRKSDPTPALPRRATTDCSRASIPSSLNDVTIHMNRGFFQIGGHSRKMGGKKTLTKLADLQDTIPAKRPALFIKKLQQCCFMFDFKDPRSDPQGKQIKTNTLEELIEYEPSDGAVNIEVYSFVTQMVCVLFLVILF
jgi:hypothetical protein